MTHPESPPTGGPSSPYSSLAAARAAGWSLYEHADARARRGHERLHLVSRSISTPRGYLAVLALARPDGQEVAR